FTCQRTLSTSKGRAARQGYPISSGTLGDKVQFVGGGKWTLFDCVRREACVDSMGACGGVTSAAATIEPRVLLACFFGAPLFLPLALKLTFTLACFQDRQNVFDAGPTAGDLCH